MAREDAEKEAKESALWSSLSGLGIEFLCSLAVPGLLGWWLDKMLGTSPWLILLGIAFGFAIGLYLMVRASNRLLK